MKIDRGFPYYLLLLLFPVSFLLHNVNENFGLIPLPDALFLLAVYLITTIGLAFLSKWILRRYPQAFVFSFLLLLINFLFGAFRDFSKVHHFPALINRYVFFLPVVLLILIAAAAGLARSRRPPLRLARALAVFLVINVAYETGWCFYNLASGKAVSQDFGDARHNLITKLNQKKTGTKPVVFWLVFDEYAGSSSVKEVWGLQNPLEPMLRKKGFFVAGSARSNYNFTHFSLSSTLDMAYLSGLQNHSIVRLKDLERGNYSVWDNNTVRLFEQNGYAINNFTIFQMKGHPTGNFEMFRYVPKQLINFQTFEGRVRSDIGWNFPNLLKRDRRAADSAHVSGMLNELDTAYKNQVDRFLLIAAKAAREDRPSFNMFHLQLPHEPYFYHADGSIAYSNGYSDSAKHYPAHLLYTNSVVNRMADSLLALYRRREVVIIIQGDHGFKYQENEAWYDRFSCSILYAVYCSDGNYSAWPQNLTSVNGFRILFNKYLNTALPLLPNHSYNLYYR